MGVVSIKRIAIIIAGGEGKRLWPASTPAKPKQFLKLVGEQTLLEATWERALAVPNIDEIWVVTGNVYKEETLRTLPALPEKHLILEPSSRNTGPALALAMAHIARETPDASILVLPADHYIPDRQAFSEAADAALRASVQYEALVTFGLQPTRPETGYGYIELGNQVTESVYDVIRFVEKPDPKRAKNFLASGKFLWNSGMFAWQLSTFIREMERHAPSLYQLFGRVLNNQDWYDEWEGVQAISVDYAILERTEQVVTVKSAFEWDDLGSWLAFGRYGSKDSHENFHLGVGPIHTEDSSKNIVLSSGSPVIVLGVQDMVIAVTDNGTLVANTNSLPRLKEALAALEGNGPSNGQ